MFNIFSYRKLTEFYDLEAVLKYLKMVSDLRVNQCRSQPYCQILYSHTSLDGLPLRSALGQGDQLLFIFLMVPSEDTPHPQIPPFKTCHLMITLSLSLCINPCLNIDS